MSEKIFITSTLPYINSRAHMGHAFEFILGDVLARFYRDLGEDVVFNIGLDEHGSKVQEKASELGLSPLEHVIHMRKEWIGFCDTFNISYDNFYETASAMHHNRVHGIWNSITETIYRKHYRGQYCTGCESYKRDKDLVDGKCPDHPNTEIKTLEQENYFFRLTSFKDRLLQLVKGNDKFLYPESKRAELINLIHEVEDMSISRNIVSCSWGIDVPGSETENIYVWFEALLNYIIAAGYNPKFDNPTSGMHWDKVIQICGPDNLRFQGLVFQAILMELGVKNTDHLLVHGTIMGPDGKKMSKSSGNVIDPMEQVEKYGVDAVRYYAAAGLSTTQNSSWSEKELVERWNAEICNEWGNLVSRFTHLISKNQLKTSYEKDWTLIDHTRLCVKNAEDSLRAFDLKAAYEWVSKIVRYLNVYIGEKQPWKLEGEEYVKVMYAIGHGIYYANKLYSYILPEQAEQITLAVQESRKIIPFQKILK